MAAAQFRLHHVNTKADCDKDARRLVAAAQFWTSHAIHVIFLILDLGTAPILYSLLEFVTHALQVLCQRDDSIAVKVVLFHVFLAFMLADATIGSQVCLDLVEGDRSRFVCIEIIEVSLHVIVCSQDKE